MTTTQLTTIIASITPEYYGDFAADFDTDAVNDDYREALNAAAKAIVPSITVTGSGIVYVDVEDVETARDIDWNELAEGIDVEEIVKRHEIGAPTSIVQIDAEKAEYIAATLRTIGRKGGEITDAGITVDGDDLAALATLGDDCDGHYDGTHVWIGGTEYDVTSR